MPHPFVSFIGSGNVAWHLAPALDNAGFVFDNDKNDFGVQMIGIAEAKSGWPVWSDLRKFCKKSGLDLSILIEGLDFSSLEG